MSRVLDALRSLCLRLASVTLLGLATLQGAEAQVYFLNLGGLRNVRQTPHETYLLGTGDEVSIVVLRHPEFSTEAVVSSTGVIPLPSGGSVLATDISLEDLAKQVTDKLRSRLLHPEVFVRLKAARMQNFYVLGDVQRSGVLDVKPNWGVPEALSASGGLSAGVAQKDVRVTVQRISGQRISLPLEEALLKTGPDALRIVSGDVLRFDAVGTLPVYITGKVKAPGTYRLHEDNPDLLTLVAMAGGVSDDASLSNVRIVRATGDVEVVDLTPALVRGESVRLPRLASGEVVVVSESLTRYAVLGYVAKPGYFPLPQGRSITLSEAIAEAQGADRRARLSKVGVVRMVNGKPERKVYDLGKFLQKGDASQNPVVNTGDVIYVPETNKVDTASILGNLTSAALLFNIFRP